MDGITLNILDDKDEMSLSIGDVGPPIEMVIQDSSTGGNYNRLANKPTINGVTMQGDKGSVDYWLQDKMDVVTEQDIDNMLYGVE